MTANLGHSNLPRARGLNPERQHAHDRFPPKLFHELSSSDGTTGSRIYGYRAEAL